MNRAKILAQIDVAHSRGLEIGPLNRPVVTRAMGPVEYIDRASRDELRAWYAVNDEVNIDDIVEVDHVWGDQTLFECVGGRRIYDYVVASHVIEHVPDLFGWLAEIAAVLADGAIASFVAPDKRYTFDLLRRTSSESELVDAYVRGLRRPEARQIFDHFNNFRDISPEAILNGASLADLAPTHSAAELLDLCRRTQANGDYIDAHCWVFTPRSFVEAMDLGSRLGLLPFEIAGVDPTSPRTQEFFVALRRLPDDLPPDAQRAAFVASRDALDLPKEGGDGQDPDQLMARVHFAESQLAAFRASTIWRVSAPLRGAVDVLRRLRRRDGA